MTSSCHTPGGEDTPCRRPWADHPRAADNDALLKYAVENREGVRFMAAARAVLNPDADAGGADHQHARRFYTGHPDLFDIERRGGVPWVVPTREAVSLKRSMERVGTPDGGGVACQPSVDYSETPRERVRRMLSEVRGVDSDEFGGVLLREFGRHKAMNADSRVYFMSGETGEVVSRPCGDRYTDEVEAGAVRARAEEVLDAVSGRFEVGTWVTYTVPRGCVGSVASSVSELRGYKNALHDRLGYSPAAGSDLAARPEEVPPHVVFVEPHRSGVAHLHVVYLGVSRLVDWRALRAMWAEVVGASGPVQVDIRSLGIRGDQWVVRRRSGGETVAEYGRIREYLLGTVRRLARLASLSSEAVFERADALAGGEGTAEDRDLAALAVVWASGCEVVTPSRSLRRELPSSFGSSSGSGSVWVCLGVFTYGATPRWIRERAVFVSRRGATRPPPRAVSVGERR